MTVYYVCYDSDIGLKRNGEHLFRRFESLFIDCQSSNGPVYCSLCYIIHFSKMWYLFFYVPVHCPFALKIYSITRWSMFYILP